MNFANVEESIGIFKYSTPSIPYNHNSNISTVTNLLLLSFCFSSGTSLMPEWMENE